MISMILRNAERDASRDELKAGSFAYKFDGWRRVSRLLS